LFSKVLDKVLLQHAIKGRNYSQSILKFISGQGKCTATNDQRSATATADRNFERETVAHTAEGQRGHDRRVQVARRCAAEAPGRHNPVVHLV